MVWMAAVSLAYISRDMQYSGQVVPEKMTVKLK